MYRSIGYYTEQPSTVLINACRALVDKFAGADFDTVFSDAFRDAGLSDRRRMDLLTRDDIIQLSKSSKFGPNTDEFRDLLHVVYAIMAASGWGDHRPAVIRYTVDPLKPLDDILTDALQEHVERGLNEVKAMWPQGERTNCMVETFRTHLGMIIRRIALLYDYRPYVVDKLERYMGDLLFRMKVGEIGPNALEQFDRTLLYYMVYKQADFALKYTTSAGEMTLKFPDAKDSDPLIGPEIARLRNAMEPGPWLRYTRLLSTAEPRELIYQLSPVVSQLPITTGYLVPVGPFHELHLEVVNTIAWGDAEQLAGLLENVSFPMTPDSAQSQMGFRNSLGLTLSGSIPANFDYPGLEVINDTDDVGKPRLKYSWQSPTVQRRIHDTAGATSNNLVTDIASRETSKGESSHKMLNIDGISFADLRYINNADRRIISGVGSAVENDPILRTRVKEKVWYFSAGKNLLSKDVDVTALYNKLGNVSFRPALAEFFKPSRSWFLQPDPRAVDYIAGQLGLGVYDAKRSVVAITLSHNYATYMRLVDPKGKGDEAAPFDLEAVIRAMHGMDQGQSLPVTTKPITV